MWRFANYVVADMITSSWQGKGPSGDRLGVRALENTKGCTIRFDRRPLPGLSANIVPAIVKDGMIVAWQDVDVIVLQRFSRNCVADGSQVEVNRTEDFWRRPGQNSLTDVAAFPGGAAAVVWTLGGDVWVRVVRAGIAGGHARGGTVRVNNPDRFLGSDRSEARVVPNPEGDGFVVVWSSWRQDGDGWGVFSRPFELNGLDARPMGEEKQVNQIWKHFQWQPQLKWCGDALWALWANGTTGQCWGGSDCATGPFLRLLAREGSTTKDPQEAEIKFNGDGPIAATLACPSSGNQVTASSTAAFWLQPSSKGGSEVIREFSEPKKEHLHSEGDSAPSNEWLRRRRLAPLPVYVDSQSLRSAVPNNEEVKVNGAVQARNLRAQDIYDLGAVSMVAHEGLVVILTSSLRGELGAQLLDFGSYPVAYPQRLVAVDVRSAARAAWDAEGGTLALVTCWATGGAAAEDEMPSSFVCTRHPARWLVESDGLELGTKLGLIVMMLLVSIFCCFRYCQQHGRIGPHGRAVLARRVRTGGSLWPRRNVNQSRLRELREQLAQIPMVALEGSPAAPPSSFGTESADGSSSFGDGAASACLGSDTTASDLRWTPPRGMGEPCAICQNEVTVWVALRPCGHTACRDCVSRIVEMNQRCHICRGSIEGVLPVYI